MAYDAPGYLDIQRARAAAWLLRSTVDICRSLEGVRDAGIEDLEGLVRGIAEHALSTSLAAAELKIVRDQVLRAHVRVTAEIALAARGGRGKEQTNESLS